MEQDGGSLGHLISSITIGWWFKEKKKKKKVPQYFVINKQTKKYEFSY